MRVALFHDGDVRVPRLREELALLHHDVVVVGRGASRRWVHQLFFARRPDILHSLGRGSTALLLAAWWRRRLAPQGTRRVHDTAGVPFVDAVVDGSLMGPHLVVAYARVLGFVVHRAGDVDADAVSAPPREQR